MNRMLNGDEPGLVAYYPFNEGLGYIVVDKVAGHYGTIHGTPNWIASYHLANTNVAALTAFPGYVHPPEGTSYNADLYNYPTETNQDVTSHIFAVHTNGLLEVWWAVATRNADMRPPVYYPSLAQRYRNQWPTNPPPLVIASGRGSGTTGVTFSDSANPQIYWRSDPTQPGFNPNEEHALVLQNTIYALRNDLNRPGDPWSSEPYVLVEFITNTSQGAAAPAMRVFAVVATNSDFPAFTNAVTAGQMIQPPMPLAALPGANNTNTVCAAGPGWRDRKLAWWAKAAGDDGSPTGVVMRFWYALENGFFFPTRQANQLATGTLVPWLSGNYYGVPVDYTFSAVWPADTPTLALAQTLYVSPANSGLPDIHNQLSVEVVYEQSMARSNRHSVTVIDPLVRRGAYVDLGVIQQMAGAGLATRQSPGATYTFPGAPPSLGSRLVYDPNQPTNNRLSVVGSYVTTLTDGYLLLNLLESFEYSNVYHLADGLQTPVVAAWRAAVSAMPTSALAIPPNTPYVKPALSAGLGEGCGYVTVAFNNSTNRQMVPDALPISLAIMRVTTNLYTGSIEVIPPEDPLDEKLTLRQQADYAGEAGQYYFEWRTLPPTEIGLPPTNVPPEQWLYYDGGVGRPGITIQGAGLYTLVDNFFISRYRPVNPHNPAGTNTWSAWVLGFAPGWVQRSLNAITPFEQRITDMVNNSPDLTLSMISLAGGPYSGPVALNLAHINDVGLIPIYETILQRARMLSIDAGISYPAADSTLKLAAGRLHGLYMLLGNEAYADAQDPTIAFGSDDVTYGAQATSLFCFENQVAKLLEEELALLRGRDGALLPPTTQGPFFNRLPWNFTRDLTGGEVAYALNYGITGTNGPNPTISAEDAARAFPQGHGDAWGHYLSAIMGYYQLLASPYFDWIPGIGTMLLGGGGNLMLSVGYYDEQKFAEAAAARARTGADIVGRTYRHFYADSPGGRFPGYRDANTTRAWGVAEWASRAGQGAFLDWAVANSLLPPEAAQPSRDWALAFTNADSYVDFGTHSLSADSGMTLEMWVQSVAQTNMALFGGYTTDWNLTPQTNRFGIDRNGAVEWYSSSDRQTIRSTNTVADGLWHHVAFVYRIETGGVPERIIYVDGVEHQNTPGRNLYWNNWQWSLGAFQAGPGGRSACPSRAT